MRYRRPECGQLLRGTHGYRDEFDSLLSDPSSQETQSSLHHLASHRPEVLFQVYDHSRWPYDSYPVSCQPYILISEHVCVWNVMDLEGFRLIVKVFHFIAIFKSFAYIKTYCFLRLWTCGRGECARGWWAADRFGSSWTQDWRARSWKYPVCSFNDFLLRPTGPWQVL